jgi:hypothetical protein
MIIYNVREGYGSEVETSSSATMETEDDPAAVDTASAIEAFPT